MTINLRDKPLPRYIVGDYTAIGVGFQDKTSKKQDDSYEERLKELVENIKENRNEKSRRE